MAQVLITKSKLDNLADAISEKSSATTPLTVDEMTAAVQSIVIGSTINNQNKTITPSASAQTVTADSGYTGLGTVTVQGDADLIAGNIKSGVDIFGITGTLAADYPILTEATNSTGITANITTIEQPLELSVKNISTSGTYSASTDNVDGYSQVIVDAPIPTGTTVSKIVGEGESISKGDFVTLDDNYWYYPSYYYKPNVASYISICACIDDSEGSSVIISHPGENSSQTMLETFNIFQNSVQNVNAGLRIDNVAGAYVYPNLIYLQDNIVLYCSRYGTELRAVVRNWNIWSSIYSNYLSVASGSSPYPYLHNRCVKLTSTSVLVAYPKSNGIYCNILTLDNNVLSKGTETLVYNYAGTASYIDLCALDSTTIAIGFRKDSSTSSIKTIGIIKINNNVPSMAATYDTDIPYNAACYFQKYSNDSFLISEVINDVVYLRKYTWNNTSIVKDNNALWSESNGIIMGIVVNSTNISLLLKLNQKLYFVLLNLNGVEIARVQIAPLFIATASRYSDLIYLNNLNCYVAAYSVSDSLRPEYYAGISLIKWDGTALQYKNDYLKSYDGNSLYGIAMEDGDAGDTIQVLIPTAPVEEVTENDNL